ncbi:MAG: hypothetical protein JNK15_17945 [Planctomycetes bacterium]|nr:hypothetical protein [Planctomycetota bacterium]
MIPLLLTSLLACQDPAQSPEARPARDVVELKNGDRLEGRITTSLDGYLEIELEAGATIGIATAQVAAVHRGAGPAAAAPGTVARSAEWFVLHDAKGQAVGWLSTSVSPRADGFVVAEEYEFQHGRRRYQVTSQATAAANGDGTTAYFRERITEPVLPVLLPDGSDAASAQERVVDERIVEAKVLGDRLAVQILDASGRSERQLRWTRAHTFPLLARVLARITTAALGERTLFDPATQELVVRSYDGSRRRTVTIDGQPMQITEVAESGASGRNAEWVDATARTLRRELSGPALVAVPSSAASCRTAVGAVSIAPAIVAEAGGTFGLWLPNPAWITRDGVAAGTLVLACEPHGASISLSRLDHLEPGTPLPSAADAVATWFRLLQPGLTVESRSDVAMRERPAVRLFATGRRDGVPTRAQLDVIAHQGRFLVLACVAPLAAWDELAGDFAFVQRTVELDAQALAPQLQGPIAAREKRARPQVPVHRGPQDVVPVSPAPSPVAKPVASPAGPRVYIPKER